MKILCFDPGDVNFAYCLVKYKKGVLKVKETGLVEPIFGLTEKDNVNYMVKQFRDWIEYLIKKFKLKRKKDCIVIERYMVRGGFLNTKIELCSFMIGILADVAHLNKIDVNLYPAAVWKNHYTRNYWKQYIQEQIKKGREINKQTKKFNAFILMNHFMGCDIYPEKIKNRWVKKEKHPLFENEHTSCACLMGVYYLEKKYNKDGKLLRKLIKK